MKGQTDTIRQGKPLPTHRQIDDFCPNGHRLSPLLVKVGDEQTATCRKCGKRVTFKVSRDGERLKVEKTVAAS